MVQVLGRETLDMLADEIPLRKLGRPEDIAEAMLFLAKSEYTHRSGHLRRRRVYNLNFIV